MSNKLQKRITKQDILMFRERKMTYQQIANQLGISRQRVHQIFKEYLPAQHKGGNYRSEIKEPKFYAVGRAKTYIYRCLKCGKEISVVSDKRPRYYCSRKCYFDVKYNRV